MSALWSTAPIVAPDERRAKQPASLGPVLESHLDRASSARDLGCRRCLDRCQPTLEPAHRSCFRADLRRSGSRTPLHYRQECSRPPSSSIPRSSPLPCPSHSAGHHSQPPDHDGRAAAACPADNGRRRQWRFAPRWWRRRRLAQILAACRPKPRRQDQADRAASRPTLSPPLAACCYRRVPMK
jgi:hypothetical protein